jgi:rubrerythrin
MHFTSPLPRSRRRARKRAKASGRAAQGRNQRADATQDAAVYTCSCGYIFKAAVTTSVGCPHCGTEQGW